MQLAQTYPVRPFKRVSAIALAPITATGPKGFLMYLKREQPAAYAVLQRERPDLITQGLSGLGDTATPAAPAATGWAATISSWGTSILDVVSKAIPVYQQQQIMKTQLSRAKAGLPPLKASDYAPPGIPITVGLPEEIQAGIESGLTIGKIALIAGVGLVAFMVLSRPASKSKK